MSLSGRSSRGSLGGASSSRAPTKTRQERQTNFKVVIRVRPPIARELENDVPFQNIVAVDDREQCITVSENLDAVLDEEGNVLANPGPYRTLSFMFDYVYDQNCTQQKVYETTASTVVDSALQGYNATIFAYGQTGTGKTFTMEGFNRGNGTGIEARGIIPRAIEQIFGHIQAYASPRMRFLVRASYLQIYNEEISDLLKPERSNLTIREDKRRGVYVEGLSEWVVRSPAEIYGLMERGGAIRATGETKMNELSSRSHAVFVVIAEQSETVYTDEKGNELSPEEFQKLVNSSRGARREQDMRQLENMVRQSFKVGKLNLVDLAGSENVRLSGATGQRLEESKKINRSLSALGNVISALTEAKGRQHIPYRDSRLTRMLEDSLGGNCKTTMMAMISPAFEAMQETISTLKFANRAKNIKNEAKVNEDLDQKSLLRKYERELKKLRAELDERSKNVVDKRRLLELDEQRRRAEADKMMAIRALEARSVEFMKEKEEKKKLEQRIASLMGQMIRGDKEGGGGSSNNSGGGGGAAGGGDMDGGGGAPMHVMVKEQQEKLSKEYEFKLADLERERETIEEEKAQVDRYKQLLLKQRDIMIALTQRLVERDEQIMALQDELDAYDSHHKELEEKLDQKTAMLIKFQRISMEVNANSPYKNEELSKAMESWSQPTNRPSGATEVVNGEEDDLSSPPSAARTAAVIEGQRAKIVELERKLLETSPNLLGTSGSGSGSSGYAPLASAGKDLPAVEASSMSVQALLRTELDGQLRNVQDPVVKKSITNAINNVVGALSRANYDSFSVGSALDDRTNSNSSSGSNGRIGTTSDAAIKALKEENARLKAMNVELEVKSANNSSNNSAELQTKCNTLIKERDAVQTIMEHKIKLLVQNVAQSASAVVNGSPQIASTAPGQALSKDLVALQRLVNASIAALRNAAAASSSSSSGGGNGGTGSKAVPKGGVGTTNSNSNNSSSYSTNGRASASSSMPAAPPPPPPPPSSSSSDNAGAAVSSHQAVPHSVTPGAASGMGNSQNIPIHNGGPSTVTSATAIGAGNVASGGRGAAAGTSTGSWGAKDQYYSAGDVFRR